MRKNIILAAVAAVFAGALVSCEQLEKAGQNGPTVSIAASEPSFDAAGKATLVLTLSETSPATVSVILGVSSKAEDGFVAAKAENLDFESSVTIPVGFETFKVEVKAHGLKENEEAVINIVSASGAVVSKTAATAYVKAYSGSTPGTTGGQLGWNIKYTGCDYLVDDEGDTLPTQYEFFEVTGTGNVNYVPLVFDLAEEEDAEAFARFERGDIQDFLAEMQQALQEAAEFYAGLYTDLFGETVSPEEMLPDFFWNESVDGPECYVEGLHAGSYAFAVISADNAYQFDGGYQYIFFTKDTDALGIDDPDDPDDPNDNPNDDPDDTPDLSYVTWTERTDWAINYDPTAVTGDSNFPLGVVVTACDSPYFITWVAYEGDLAAYGIEAIAIDLLDYMVDFDLYTMAELVDYHAIGTPSTLPFVEGWSELYDGDEAFIFGLNEDLTFTGEWHMESLSGIGGGAAPAGLRKASRKTVRCPYRPVEKPAALRLPGGKLLLR